MRKNKGAYGDMTGDELGMVLEDAGEINVADPAVHHVPDGHLSANC